MFTDRFLRRRRGVSLTTDERAMLESAVAEERALEPRKIIVRAGDPLSQSLLLTEGILSRYIDDRHGHRQLVAIHVAGDFVDLHGYPLKVLDHDVGTMTAAKVAIVPHAELDRITAQSPELARKLWYATLIDAAIHRAWLFRLGRLDAVGRVAHFLCETNARLMAAGLSDGHSFSLPLTQTDLSEICGLTNVHVNRVLRQLREERLCVFRSSLVEIPDLEKLAARAQFDPDYLYIEAPELVS
ncbi:Crp/Fnr family transcriptional regulator [Novosphingobium sp. Rr 2-17]|uniref:Crp/Fnr family transcriptional regulator n=1 Tax=Novosphingobium sp. Rr 2-17 TaxID=555793 RepID=UPI00178C3023|nr:Crp/Fnr family transcriptional regulator [Novosphingobium sp. Rr 2-17]